MTMSPLGTIVAGVLLLAFVVWTFRQAAGPPPADMKRHKWARKMSKVLYPCTRFIKR